MSKDEQKEFILNYILNWAGSGESAQKWYELEIIPALNKTAKQAVECGQFEGVKRYLKQVELGGFA